MKIKKYTVTYQVPHWHTVTVGICATSARSARHKAHAAFLDLSLWDDTEACPLLVDDFDEDTEERIEIERERRVDDAKNPLGFFAQSVADWPQPTDVVLKDRKHRDALALLAEIRRMFPALVADQQHFGTVTPENVGDHAAEQSRLIWPRLQALTARH